MLVPIRRLKVLNNFAFIPNMIASSNDINAHVEQVFRQRRSDSKTRGGVLAISNHQVNRVLPHQFCKVLLDDGATWPAENVANE
jgi:hypothetical protein